MIIQNLISNNDFSQYGDYEKLCRRLKQNHEQLTDVTDEPFGRGDKTIVINNTTFDVNDFDCVVKGKTAKLYMTNTHELVVVNVEPTADMNVIMPIIAQEDTNFLTGYRFQPFTDYNDSKFKSRVLKKLLMKEQTKRMITEKVVGTSFRPQPPFEDFAGTLSTEPGDNVPVKISDALLIPEPNNQYDPNAIMVVARLANNQPHHLGYLARGSQLQINTHKPTKVTLKITAYSMVGDYNDSYHVMLDPEA